LQRGEAETAASAFDRALARDPSFPRRGEMAPAYLALGRALKKDAPDRARAALRKAMRVDPAGPLAKAAESELLVLEARALAGRGVIDEGALRRAVTLDPENSDAKDELSRLAAESSARSGRFSWYTYGAIAFLLALAGVAAAIVHGRRSVG
jgi:tetratricopeptide (TPR) repeat protein